MTRQSLNQSLNKIALDAEEKRMMLAEILEQEGTASRPVLRRLSMGVVALVSILILTVTTVLAVSLGWHEQLIAYFQMTDTQMEQVEPGMEMPTAVLSQQGITITVKQTLADRVGVYVVYDVEIPAHMGFAETATFSHHVFDVSSAFPEDIGEEYVMGMVSAPIVLEETARKRTILQYFGSDGTIVNGTALLRLHHFNYRNGAQLETLEGLWQLEWDFQYRDTSRTVELDAPVYFAKDKAVTRLIISPLSISVDVSGAVWMPQEVDMKLHFSNGEELNCSVFSEKQRLGDHGSVDADREHPTSQLYHSFHRLIDVAELESFEIDGIVIPLHFSGDHE